MDKFLKFFPLVKVDVEKRLVYGLVTAEVEDRDEETCHYDSTKPEYQKVIDEMEKASDGGNIMPLREMHQLIAAGAGKAINFDDSKKQIKMAFYVSDNSTWQKVLDKVLLGFSQGGKYLKRWTEKGKQFYTAEPGEVSLVDRPCLAGALIEYAKADGTIEMYKTAEAKLSEADVDRLVKALDTQWKEFRIEHASLMAKLSAGDDKSHATGANSMKPEEIKKCAAALGISEEDFKKLYVDGDALEKGKKGLAALHAHLKKAHSLHEKMHSLHKTMGEHHAQMAEHMENCMKAHAACMDGEEADKVLKAAANAPAIEYVSVGKTSDGVEVFKLKSETKEVKLDKAAAETFSKADVEKMIKEALDKAPSGDAADRAAIFKIARDADEKKQEAAKSQDAIPV